MAEALEVTTQAQPGDLAEQKAPAPFSLWQRLALGGVMLISLFMNFYQLGQNGFGNLYSSCSTRVGQGCKILRRALIAFPNNSGSDSEVASAVASRVLSRPG